MKKEMILFMYNFHHIKQSLLKMTRKNLPHHNDMEERLFFI